MSFAVNDALRRQMQAGKPANLVELPKQCGPHQNGRLNACARRSARHVRRFLGRPGRGGLVALQEIYKPSWELWSRLALPPHHASVDAIEGKLQSSVLYDASVWDVRCHEHAQLEDRVFQWVLLRNRRSGRLLSVYNVNGWHGATMTDVLDGARSLCTPLTTSWHATVLLGDLNLNGPPAAARGALRRVGAGGNTCCYTDSEDGPARTFVWSLDHIYVSRHLRHSEFSVSSTQGLSSDHLPVQCVLSSVHSSSGISSMGTSI